MKTINMTGTGGEITAKVLDYIDREGKDKVLHMSMDTFNTAMRNETLRPRMAGRHLTTHTAKSAHFDKVTRKVLVAVSHDLDDGQPYVVISLQA